MKNGANSIIDKKIYVITFAKNGEQYINKLLESLLNQTNTNFTHYIYDDGSNNTLEPIVKKYIENVNKIKKPFKVCFERNSKNIGINLSTAHCISKVDTDYFIWINCDDYIDKNFINEMYKAINESNGADIIVSNIKYVLKNKKRNFNLNYINKKPLLTYIVGQRWTGSYFMVKTHSYFVANPNNLIVPSKIIHNDVQLFLLAFSNNWNWYYAKNAISYFVERPNSAYHIYGSGTLEKHLDFLKIYWPNNLNIILEAYKLREHLDLFEKYFSKFNYKETKKEYKIIVNYLKCNNVKLKNVFNSKTILKLLISKSFLFFKFCVLLIKLKRL